MNEFIRISRKGNISAASEQWGLGLVRGIGYKGGLYRICVSSGKSFQADTYLRILPGFAGVLWKKIVRAQVLINL